MAIDVAAVARAVAAWGLLGTRLRLPTEQLTQLEAARLIHAATRQRITGLCTAAVEAGELQLPDDAVKALHQQHLDEMVGVLLLERELLTALDLLGSAGVPTVALKGSAIAHLAYVDPSLRGFGDVDLLVQGMHFDAAVSALQASGYRRLVPQAQEGHGRRFGRGASMVSPVGREVDLHRTLAHGPFGLSIHPDDLWEETERIEIGARPVVVLGSEQRILHAAYHAALGAWPARLAPLRDLAEMLLFSEYDPDRLVRMATRWHGDAVLADAVRSAWATLQLADIINVSAWAERHVSHERQTRLLQLYRADYTSYSAKSRAESSSLPTVSSRLSFLWSMAMLNHKVSPRNRVNWFARSRRGFPVEAPDSHG